jgi:hypothetical protein
MVACLKFYCLLHNGQWRLVQSFSVYCTVVIGGLFKIFSGGLFKVFVYTAQQSLVACLKCYCLLHNGQWWLVQSFSVYCTVVIGGLFKILLPPAKWSVVACSKFYFHCIVVSGGLFNVSLSTTMVRGLLNFYYLLHSGQWYFDQGNADSCLAADTAT